MARSFPQPDYGCLPNERVAAQASTIHPTTTTPGPSSASRPVVPQRRHWPGFLSRVISRPTTQRYSRRETARHKPSPNDLSPIDGTSVTGGQVNWVDLSVK